MECADGGEVNYSIIFINIVDVLVMECTIELRILILSAFVCVVATTLNLLMAVFC